MDIETQLLASLKKQIVSFFDLSSEEMELLRIQIPAAHKRTISCFKSINNKYYDNFQLTHSGQYATFLYFLSNEIFKNTGRNELSDKLYYLNKIMHSIDLYYEVQMPDIYYWEHPLGTVLGRAQYGNYFTVYQSCTVGGNWDKNGALHYPVIGNNVTLFSYACILGNCKIGNNSIIASHAYLIDQDIPDNSIVFGQGNNLVIKPNKRESTIFKT